MARVTQEHVDARRRQILDAAHRQFGLKGVDPGAATLDDVAEEAGLSKGSIYSYFKNKDQLLAAVREDAAEQDLSMARDAVDEAASPWDALSGLLHHVWDGMTRPENRERNMLAHDYLLHEVRSGDVDPDVVSRPIDGLTWMIERAQADGSVAADLDARVLATTVWNVQQGTRAHYLRTGDREMAMAVLAMIEDLIGRTAPVS